MCGIVLAPRTYPGEPRNYGPYQVLQVSATEVPNGKPAPDLFLHAASRMGVQAAECIVIEDSTAGVSAATAAGMTAVGFVGGSHADAELGAQLKSAGARAIVADLRHLKSAVVAYADGRQ